MNLSFRPARDADLPALDAIRQAAFEPVFASFREILGDELYERVQGRADAEQAELLRSFFAEDSVWEVFVAELDAEAVGFVVVRVDANTEVGEIGLNAVHPSHAGRGIGTAMYEFALDLMRRKGARAATVATGGDPSHAPARRAYEKVGFDRGIPSVWYCRLL